MYYPRTIVSTLKDYLNRSEVLILLGARQVGKTSILKILQENLKHENIIYLDLDIETNKIILKMQLYSIMIIQEEDKTCYYFIPYIFAGKGIRNIDELI